MGSHVFCKIKSLEALAPALPRLWLHHFKEPLQAGATEAEAWAPRGFCFPRKAVDKGEMVEKRGETSEFRCCEWTFEA